ncbi:MAG: zinc metallopeptidase [Deltaproteobacteria bacterium]|nr:zinc metallopeptidase [Deltaproteobacteria bacterium]
MPLFGMFIDPLYLAVVAPGFLLAAWASFKVKSTFARYREVESFRRMTGAQTAREILRRNNLNDVQVLEADGMLSDHYDPRTRTVRLSPEVYRVPSIASVAVAAHEVGHALQHAQAYGPMVLRSMAVPVAQLGSFAPWIIMIGGFLLHMTALVYVGVILFTAVVLFQIITLPVELNASTRAREQLESMAMVSNSEMAGVRKVLSAAAMTYVAGALTAILTLLYYLIRLGIIGGSRRD